MESWAIFKHAVRMVFENFGDAIKVTGVLYLAMFVAQLVLVGTLMSGDEAAMQAAMTAGTMPLGRIGLYGVIATILSIWAVVGWHRYVLLEERPALAPKLLPANMLSYLWRTILVTLIIIVPSAIAGGLAGAVGGVLAFLVGAQSGAEFGAAFGSAAGAVVAMTIIYRLSPMFPAVALGTKMGFAQASDKFRGKNGMLFALALISTAASLVLSIPTFILEPTALVAQAYAFIFGWVQLTVGASIITTLYGVYVEGRELTRS